MVEITHHRHFDRSEMKWSEVEKSSYNTNNMKKVINTIKWNNKDFSTPLRYARNDKEHVSFRPKRNEMERSGEILF